MRRPSPARRPPASPRPASASLRPAASACSCRSSFGLPFSRVEGLLQELEELLLADRFLVAVLLEVFSVLAERERDCEATARHFVERVLQQRRVLRILRELPVEVGNRRALDGP